MNNSIAIVDRELVDGSIEGVYFGPRLWVIARSPIAVLAWVYGHSYWSAGWSNYAPGYLLILPDRTSRFMHQPRYKSLRHEMTRLTPVLAHLFSKEITETFGSETLQLILNAIAIRKTIIIEGGGGSLRPLNCHGDTYKNWLLTGGGFISREEVNKGLRYKLGYKGETV